MPECLHSPINIVSVHLIAFEVNELIIKKTKKPKKKQQKRENQATSEKNGTNTSKLMTASPQAEKEAKMNLSDELLQFRRGKLDWVINWKGSCYRTIQFSTKLREWHKSFKMQTVRHFRGKIFMFTKLLTYAVDGSAIIYLHLLSDPII